MMSDGSCECCGERNSMTSGGCLGCNSSRTYCHCGKLMNCGCGRSFAHFCRSTLTDGNPTYVSPSVRIKQT
jgi:hypothetical protein